MGLTKGLTEEREARWQHVARNKGWECQVCGTLATRDDLDQFLSSGLCCGCRTMRENWLRD